jgi:hypothetical protein
MYVLCRHICKAVEVYLIEVTLIEIYHIGKGAVEVSGLPCYTNRWYGYTVIVCRACNLTACLTGLVEYPFAAHQGPGFDPCGGTYTPVSVVSLQ